MTEKTSKIYSFSDVKNSTLEYFNGDELATDVWMGKYCLKDSDGNLYEKTPDDMHKRLAKEFSKIENEYDNEKHNDLSDYGKKRTELTTQKIYEYFKDFKYISPQGSIMSVLGNHNIIGSLSNCFVAGTNVLTTEGIKKIEDVNVGDVINTQTGELKPVIQTHKNRLNDRKIYELKVYKSPTLFVTENHKFLSISKEQLKWGLPLQENTVEYLRVGDYIAIPKQKEFLDVENIDITTYLNDSFTYEGRDYIVDFNHSNDKLLFETTWLNKNTPCRKKHQPINKNWKIDEDFMYFVGLWYGDGCIFSDKKGRGIRDRIGKHKNGVRGITFTFNCNETKLIDFVSKYGEMLFGIKPDINNNEKYDNSCQIVFHSSCVGIVFEKLFGRYSDGKRMSEIFYNLNDTLIDSLIQGLIDSDGTITKEGEVRVVLRNKRLIQEFYHLLRNRGIVVGYSESKKSNSYRIDFPRNSKYIKKSNKFYFDERMLKNKKESTLNHINYDGYTLLKITKKHISNLTPEYVYTLGIKDIHSYNVEGLVCMNCVVVPRPYDSYGGILHSDQQLAQLFKRRCGVGIDISTLRPENSSVTNAAGTSTGAVSFMERYSNTTREVGQSGRRGALMITIDVKHPDVFEFVKIKRDLKKVTGANISVQLRDDFMQAVQRNDHYLLSFPIDIKIPLGDYYDEIVSNLKPNEITKIENVYDSNDQLVETGYLKLIDARELWNEIIESAHASAEPGLIFKDRQHIYSTSSIYPNWENITTNPCFSGNERLLTTQGNKTFEELSGNDVEIINSSGNVVPSKVWCSGIKDTINLYNTQKEVITCTPDHIWKTVDGDDVMAKDLKGKKILPFLNENLTHNQLFLKLGFIQGDGNLTRLKSKAHLGFEVNIGENDDDVLKLFNYERTSENKKVFYTTEFTNFCENLKFSDEILPNRLLPKTINNWNNEEKLSFLSGLFSANGSIINDYRIALKSTYLPFILQVIDLLKEFDISSYYTTNKSKTISFKNGDYVCKESYDLNIARFYDLIKFYNKINFIHNYKREKLKNVIISRSPKITKIENNGPIEVYDFNDPENGWGVVNGYIAHNCSEIAMNDDSCRLMVVNLFGCVENPFTDKAKINYEKLYETTYEAQRLIDDLVDLELEAVGRIIKKIESDSEPDYIKETELRTWKNLYEKGKNGRRTGLGFTGLGDVLASLGLPYNSDAAMKVVDEMMKTKLMGEFDSSIDMAIQRGKFKDFDPKYENQSEFVHMMKDEFPELYDRMMKFGRRNISISTVAPTGSLSILTQTTSGIEPLYMIGYKRRRKIHHNEKNIKPDFVDDMGDKWVESSVLHHRVKQWLSVNNIYNPEKAYTDSPYVGSTAPEIDWVKRVKIQSIIQKYVTHSISSTINLPSDVESEKVGEIYIKAWEMGLKGITVYRDGSRSGVLVSDKEKEKAKKILFDDNHAPKRPKRLKGDIIRFQNNLEKWVAVIGLLDNRPYEIFTGKLENGLSDLPPSIKDCEVVKNIYEDEEGNRRKRYDIEYVDSNGEKQVHYGLNHTFDPEYWNYAKLISGIFRHGMPMQHVFDLIDGLNLRDEHLNTWKNGVARMVKRYIKDGVKAKGRCDECGGEHLEYKEGCLMCMSCGSGRCG